MTVRSQRHAPAALAQDTDPVAIVQRAGWARQPVRKRAENLVPSPPHSSKGLDHIA